MLFILVVVKDSFVIPEHVVHCSTAALHSKVIALKELMKGGKKKTPKRNLLPPALFLGLSCGFLFGDYIFLFISLWKRWKVWNTALDTNKCSTFCLYFWECSYIIQVDLSYNLTVCTLVQKGVIGSSQSSQKFIRRVLNNFKWWEVKIKVYVKTYYPNCRAASWFNFGPLNLTSFTVWSFTCKSLVHFVVKLCLALLPCPYITTIQPESE